MLNSPNNSAHGEIRSSPPDSIAALVDCTELGFEMTDALLAFIDWYQAPSDYLASRPRTTASTEHSSKRPICAMATAS